jgi:hypothetical protein
MGVKTLAFGILTLLFFGCRQSNRKLVLCDPADTLSLFERGKAIDSKDWQTGFGLTHDANKDTIWYKPVSYYLTDKECSGLAVDFYYGRLRPSDNGVTDELLKLATTDNDRLRPFYWWCLDKTIAIQDGALGEHTGIPARRYAEKFPKEFFQYMDSGSGAEKYNDWVGAIQYSGFYDIDDYNKPNEIGLRMAKTMKANCKYCDEKTVKQIEKFANQCFK